MVVAKQNLLVRYADFQELGLRSATKECERILKMIDDSGGILQESQRAEYGDRLLSLSQRVEDDLGDQIALVLNPKELEFFRENPFSDKVQRRFASAIDDMEEAGRCCGLERYTACAFHLMRVAEHGFGVIRSKYSIPYTDDWQKFINHIQRQINRFSEDHGKLADKNSETAKALRKEQRALEDAMDQIKRIKRRWRDPTMHVRRGGYTQSQALEVFDSVRWFLDELVENFAPAAVDTQSGITLR